jgi:ABC-type metal ion transport system substrate-binding protein
VIARSTENRDKLEYLKPAKACQSPEVKAFVEQKYQKAVVASW